MNISINSGAPVIHLICCLFYINTGCAAVFMCVCRTADTFILKFTGISAIHIRLIMTKFWSRVRHSLLPWLFYYISTCTVPKSRINDHFYSHCKDTAENERECLFTSAVTSLAFSYAAIILIFNVRIFPILGTKWMLKIDSVLGYS